MTNGHRRRGTTLLRGTTGRLVVATLLGALGTAHPAAAIDLSGDYVGFVGFAQVPSVSHFVQTGTALETTGYIVVGGLQLPSHFSGSVDPDTGAFSATGEITGVCPDAVISGTGDGEDLDYTFTAPTCPSGRVHLSKCGNGVLDPLENCEDGNFIGGDCCSARCRLDAPGTACTSDAETCTEGVCDASGTCTKVPVAGSVPCDDGNPCTVGDGCGGGVCVPGAPAPTGQACPDDLDPCTDDVCDTGTCTHVPVPPAVCRVRTACHNTCTQELKACRQTCPTRGQARRDCRAACAQQSTCTAPGAPIRTLAYVVAGCREDAPFETVGHWALNIRRGDCDPVTVMEQTAPEPVPDPIGCSNQNRYGPGFTLQGGVQRLAVRPDGSAVVFEVNNEIAVLLRPRLPPDPEQDGFFFVRADGSGLRRLGPPSHDPVFSFSQLPGENGPVANVFSSLSFSPDGRRVVFTDLGPGPAGETASQIVTLTLATGRRRQVTRLPLPRAAFPYTFFAGFLDDETITFYSLANPDGLNPQGQFTAFTVRTDGTGLRALPLTDVALPGSHVVPRFAIAGGRASVVNLSLPGMAVNPTRGLSNIGELFLLLSGRNILQVTNFRRFDTGGLFVDNTAHRVFLTASADPFGTNPTQNCQLFSVDTLGAHLRQLTHFREGDHSVNGCTNLFPAPGGCAISSSGIAREDPETGTILFDSGCDPFGTNPLGVQLFAVREDGSRLRSLTHTKGVVRYPDGSVTSEYVSSWDYAPSVR